MKLLARSLLSATIAATFAGPMAAHATNGYFLPGYGAAATGMGGAGVAFAQDSLAAATNPAGIADVGMRVDLGFAIFNPVRSSAVGTAAGGSAGNGFGFDQGSDSWNRFYLLPAGGATMPWNDKITLGIAVVGNGGMNTTYHTNFFKGVFGVASDPIGVDLMQMLVPITVAYKVDETNAIGVSLVLGGQRFAARGLQSFGLFNISSTASGGNPKAGLTNQGYDFAQGAGARIGWRGKFLDDGRLTLGATYATKVFMSKFSKYKGLFAGEGSFDVPANYALGIAFKPIPSVTAAFDVERILYAGIPAVHNRGPGGPLGFTGIPTTAGATFDKSKQLGNPDGMGFGWDSQTVYKLGFAYNYNDHWVLRTGYNYGKSPIPNDQLTFNTLAPATVEKHYTVGFTYSPNKSSEMTLAYLHAATKKQTACNQNVVGCVELKMHQNDLEFNYALKF